jgi:DNA-directed RNA polymerase subunit RPC12/RpoP
MQNKKTKLKIKTTTIPIFIVMLMTIGLFACLPGAVFAAEADEPTILIPNTSGKAGETVILTVSLENNPGLASYGITLYYDPAKLIYESAEPGNLLVSNFVDIVIGTNEVNFNSYNSRGDFETGSVLFTVTLKIDEDIIDSVLDDKTVLFAYDPVFDNFAVRVGDTFTAKSIRPSVTQPIITIVRGDVCVHDFVGVVTTPATCTEMGVMTYTCSRCGDSYTEPIAKLEPDWVVQTVVAPTCIEQGYTVFVCANCGETENREFTVALGHNWDEGVITTPATETSEGLLTYTCLRCGETRTEPIPKPGTTIAELLQSITRDVLSAKKGFDDLNNVNLVLTGKTLTLVVDGREIVLSTNANNKNQSGQIDLGDGYNLVFDIKGNGSNVKEFSVIKK